MSVVVVDYGSGNLRSVAKALERAARERGLDRAITVSSEAEAVAKAERVVLPGFASDAARYVAGADALLLPARQAGAGLLHRAGVEREQEMVHGRRRVARYTIRSRPPRSYLYRSRPRRKSYSLSPLRIASSTHRASRTMPGLMAPAAPGSNPEL